MSEDNVARVEPVAEEPTKTPERMAVGTMSFLEIVNAIREKYNAKGSIELDSDAPIEHGAMVAFKAKDTGYILARARVHLLLTPSFDKQTGNLFLYMQFIEVALGPGRAWNIAVNGAQ
jgi:hypothetical protein